VRTPNRLAESFKKFGVSVAGLFLGKDHVAGRLISDGNALLDRKRAAAALACYQRALVVKPDNAEALYRCGNSLLAMNRAADAVASYDRALELRPDYADALYNRGLALQALKRLPEAVVSYDRVLELKPDDAEAFNNRGNTFLELKRPEQALLSYDRALAIKPDYLQALHNRSLALLDLKRPAEAVASLERLFELAPEYEFVKGKLLHAKMLCCDWKHFELLTDSVDNDVRAKKKSQTPLGYQAISNSPEDLKWCAEIYAGENYPRPEIRLWTGERYRNSKIRIGYLSGEFRQQATSVLMTELFELHDRNRFELFAFDNGWDDGSRLRKRINNAFDEIVDITELQDLEAATAIKQRNIDILINLNGYFGRERLGVFSYKPCPVQVNYLGFPGTIGADYIDYIVADRIVIPADAARFYTEKVVYLPGTYQVNDSKRVIAERTPSRADVKLPHAGFVFCCFNNNFKITPVVFDTWMRLLKKIDGSILWLLEDNAAASRNLRLEAERRDVAGDRLIFAPRIKADEHLARHRLADLFLDTLPCNAHTTASDALWAGLPVLTCMGSTFAGRVASSLLNAVGLPELITYSLSEYEALALELAVTPANLACIRSKLARNRSTHALFDADRYRRHLESAYTTMWERYQCGESPEGFAVPPLP
jgi:protein O-GlcNAc transferase